MILRVDTATGEQTVVTTDELLNGPSDLTVNRAGEIISANGTGGDIVLTSPVTDQTLFATGGYLSGGWGIYLVPEPNHAPVVAVPIPDRQTDEDELFVFTIPAGTFTDEDPGDVLVFDYFQSDLVFLHMVLHA